MALTPQQRQRNASAAARARWSRELDRTDGTAVARAAFMARFKGAPATKAAYFAALAQRRHAKRESGDGPT